jgi:hypothetical protein
MTMSQKDYVAVAKVLYEARWEAVTSAPGEPERSVDDPKVNAQLCVTRDVALGLADLFEKDNSRFDRERFLRACNITDPKNVTGLWRLILDK